MNFDKYLPNYWKKIIAYSVLIEAGHLSFHLISSHLFWLNKIKFILLVLSKDRTTSHKVIKVHKLMYLQQMVDFDLTKKARVTTKFENGSSCRVPLTPALRYNISVCGTATKLGFHTSSFLRSFLVCRIEPVAKHVMYLNICI